MRIHEVSFMQEEVQYTRVAQCSDCPVADLLEQVSLLSSDAMPD